MRRWVKLAIVLGVFIASAFFSLADSGLRMFVAGRVINKDTGQGVSKVKLSLLGPAIFEATTDEEGYFIFKGVPAGGYILYLYKLPEELILYSYAPEHKLKKVSKSLFPPYKIFLEVKEGENISWIRVYLRKGAVIKGRVLKPDGSPFKGAEILPTFRGRNKIYTDENGYFVYPGIPPKEVFMVLIIPYGYPIISKSILHPEPGKVYTFTFRLCSEGGKAEVRGEVVEEGTNKPIDAMISLSKTYTSYVKECRSQKCLDSYTYTNEHGRFSFHCFLPGEYELEILPYSEGYEVKKEKIYLKAGINELKYVIKKEKTKKKGEKKKEGGEKSFLPFALKSLKKEEVDESCCNYENKINASDKEICKKANNPKGRVFFCLDKETIACIKKLCREGKIKIVCLKNDHSDCKPKRNYITYGETPNLGIGRGTIYLCERSLTNSEGCDLESTKFHEILHICDVKNSSDEEDFYGDYPKECREEYAHCRTKCVYPAVSTLCRYYSGECQKWKKSSGMTCAITTLNYVLLIPLMKKLVIR